MPWYTCDAPAIVDFCRDKRLRLRADLGYIPRMGKRQTKVAILLFVLLASSACAFALDPSLDVSQYAHTAWTVRDGFFNGPIHSIAQTPDGYLWLGTEAGLLRFDGVRAVPWRPPDGAHLPSNVVMQLLVSRDGTLWIGTGKGLASWKDGKLVQYPEMAGWILNALVEDHEGTIWAGGFGVPRHGRLCAIKDGQAQCTDPGEGLLSIYEDINKTLWVSTFNGLWRWKPQREFFQTGTTITSALVEDHDGGLLFGSVNGIQRFANGKAEVYSPGMLARLFGVDSFLWDHDGGLWIGTFEGLAHLHRGRADVFRQVDGLSATTVHCVYEDREGNIWVATEGGLDRFRDFAVPTFSAKEGFPPGLYGSILTAKDGSLWLSTSDSLAKWENSEITIYEHGGPVTNESAVTTVREIHDSGLLGQVMGLFQDSRGRLWVTMAGGFGYMENDKFVLMKAVPGRTRGSVAEGAGGDLWFSFDDALFHLVDDDKVEQILWDRLGIKDVGGSLAVDPLQGGLWIGFPQGGVAYLRHGHIERSYTTADGLGEGRISQIRVDRAGALWASTEGGLSLIKDGHVATLSAKNGLPCDAVHWSEEDADNSIWLHLECGLVRVSASDMSAWAADPNRTVRVMVLDSSDGVAAKSVIFGGSSSPVTKSLDGKLWFSVENGVSVVDPRHIPFNKLQPPVRIERVIADGKTSWQSRSGEGSSSPPKLPPLVRDLIIDYTALSLVEPEKVHFRFKLDGQDREWREVVNQRSVEYSNLAPGNYKFRVTACNNSGVWNEAGTFLDFSIAPAYYQTTWFRLSCVTAFLVMLWGLYQLRVRQLAREFHASVEARVSERTRIARDLHDTLLQSFHGLLLRFQAVSNLLPAGDAKQKLESAIDQAAQAITEGRDAVQGLRSSTVKTNDLAVAIRSFGEELATDATKGNSVEFSVQVEGTPCNLRPILRDEVYRIAGEALRNAFRHAQARQIEVEIHYDERQLRLRVRDDGKGMDPKVLGGDGRAGHFGLHGMRERAKLVGGDLTVWSEIDSGTEVELAIPASNAYENEAGRRSWLTEFGEKLSGKGMSMKS